MHVKEHPGAPDGFFAAEADGLRWLAEPRAVPVVEVIDVGPDALAIEELTETRADAAAARRFGAQLARLHDAGAPAFGFSPSPTAWFGPLTSPFSVPVTEHREFSAFWAHDRLEPVARRCARTLGGAGSAVVTKAIDVIASGAFDGVAGQGREQPSRVHGDLWQGNVLWTAQGATLIDPSAHGGHRLEDLAMLTLFGTPHLDQILSGYEQAHPMPATWREDLPAHLFFGLLAHVQLFGTGYAAQAVDTAHRIIDRARALAAQHRKEHA